MKYKKKSYSWVNEKVKDGVLVQIYRCDDEPEKCIKITDKKLKKIMDNKEIRKEWRKEALNG